MDTSKVTREFFTELERARHSARSCDQEGCMQGPNPQPCNSCLYRAHRLRMWQQLSKNNVPLTLDEAMNMSASGVSAELVDSFITRAVAALTEFERLKKLIDLKGGL